jgi:hypothetical protein
MQVSVHMKIKILLTLATILNEIVTSPLDGMGLKAEVVDYSMSLIPQIGDSKVFINGLRTGEFRVEIF